MSSFCCLKCGKTFSLKKNLQRHERFCDGSINYVCRTCKNVFSNKFNKERHENFCVEIPPCKKARLDDAPPHAYKKSRPEPTKAQLLKLSSEEYESACEGRLKSYFIRSSEFEDLPGYLMSIKDRLTTLIKLQLEEHLALKVNLVIECLFENTLEEQTDRAFKTKNKPIYKDTDLEEFLQTEFRKLTNEMEEAQLEKSGWKLVGIDGLRLRINKFSPLKGSTFIKLPAAVAAKKACINPENSDLECFRYAILAKLVVKKPQRISKYKNLVHEYDFSCISYPTPLYHIKKFEKVNNISINVFALDEEDNVYPLKVVKEEKLDHRDLLLLEDGMKKHYVYIKHFEKLIRGQKTKHHGTITVCKRCFSHFDDRYERTADEKLREHHIYCNENKPVRIELPTEEPFLKFKNFERQLRTNFVIYADLECILTQIHRSQPSSETSFTVKYQKHEPFSFCTYVKTTDNIKYLCPASLDQPYLYRGRNAGICFMSHLQQLAREINKVIKRNEKIKIDELEEREWKVTKMCYLCNGEFTENNWKTRDHCHITGKYRGAACNKCNLCCKKVTYVPVIIHNLSGYDSHFIIKDLGKIPGRIKVIPNTEERFISFSKCIDGLEFRFLDSFKFMAESLGQLVENLPKSNFKETSKYFNELELPLVLRKGVFPYDYVNSWDKLDEDCLPPKEAFFNKLTDSTISEKDYHHAQTVWENFKCSNLGEYSDLYLKTDVLLLTDVFENFRNVTMETHKIDPTHYFTAPGMAWDAMLRFTNVKLELLLDYEMILMFERGIRGGICQATLRYSKANNKYMPNYDPLSESTFISYFDANNLYGDAQSRYLPYGGFKWVERPEEICVFNIPNDSEYGYVLEVDLAYPQHLHQQHNDLPFLAESIVPPDSKTNVRKLISHLGSRRNYVVHYIALKQALNHGLQLIKIHRAIQFKQSPWLLPYIKLNTDMRKKASNNFEKNQYKLYNNANFGKTMENVRKRVNFELVNNEKRLSKLISKPNFLDRKIYDENLVGVQMAKTKLIYNKPIYVGMCILDLSKTVMYKFHYEIMQRKYGFECLKLMYTDTDSLIYKIHTDDIFKDMLDMKEHFDTSDYPTSHPNYSVKNKKVLGKFKDEVNARIINEMIALRPKMYAINVEGEIKKRAKGVQKTTLKKISLEDYKQVLFKNISMFSIMRSIRSSEHNVYSLEMNKISLSASDNKRVILQDGIHTQAYYYRDV